MVNGTQGLLEVLDTAGQEEYTALRDQWIRDGDGFLLVYSITSRSTFDRVRKFIDQISRVKDLEAYNIPIMIVGNKSDKTMEREVNVSEGMQLAQSLKCGFLEASAKTGINVEESFLGVVNHIQRQRDSELSRLSGGQESPAQATLQHVTSDRSEQSKVSGKSKKKNKEKCNIM
jgi:GTPase KRas protein